MLRANAILAVLAAALAFPVALTLVAETGRTTVFAQIPLLFDGLNVETVQRIGIGLPQPVEQNPQPGAQQQGAPARDVLVLQKVDGNWVLGAGDLAGAAVRKSLVETFVFNHLLAIRRDDKAVRVHGATEEQLREYGLTTDHAMVVRAEGAQNLKLAELLIGKQLNADRLGRDAVQGYYVRDARSRDVLVYEVTRWAPPMDPILWLDRTLTDLDVAAVAELSWRGLSTSGETVTVRRDEQRRNLWEWVDKPEKAGALRQMEITRLVSSLCRLQAARIEYHDQRPPNILAGLENPSLTVTLTMEDGAVHTLHFGNRITGQSLRYVQVVGNPFVASVPPQALAMIERDVSEYFDPSAASIRQDGK